MLICMYDIPYEKGYIFWQSLKGVISHRICPPAENGMWYPTLKENELILKQVIGKGRDEELLKIESLDERKAYPGLRNIFPREWKVLCCKDLCSSKKNLWGFPGGTSDKKPSWQCRRPGFNPWVGKIPWRKAWQPTPVFLPGESHGQRSLAGYSAWVCKESDITEAT